MHSATSNPHPMDYEEQTTSVGARHTTDVPCG